MNQARSFLPLTVPAGGTGLSGVVSAGPGDHLVGIIMPASWTTAAITFAAASAADGTFYPVFDDAGNELSVTAVQGHAIILAAPDKFRSLQHFKIRSGTSATPVDQSTAKVLTLVFARN